MQPTHKLNSSTMSTKKAKIDQIKAILQPKPKAVDRLYFGNPPTFYGVIPSSLSNGCDIYFHSIKGAEALIQLTNKN